MRTAVFLILIIAISCKPSENKKSGENSLQPQGKPASGITKFEGKAALLIQQLRDQGDYVNSRQYPSMIKPATVYAEIDSNNLVIDLRNQETFQKGHIKGAINVEMNNLISYFENDIIPFKFDKIILVSSGGQKTSYATSLLRLVGYGNVYSMRWGMAGWNSDFAGHVRDHNLSSDFQDKLLTESPEKPASANQPHIESASTTGEELLKERVSELLSLSPKQIFIKSPELFENPDKYFIVNFERKDKYEAGHIPGAYRYKQQGTLGIPSEMGTLPIDQTIVMYCGTGMSSAFAAAYLRLFGYDARSLSYGNNSFMHQKMLDEKEALSWHPFTDDLPGEFPYVKGN